MAVVKWALLCLMLWLVPGHALAAAPADATGGAGTSESIMQQFATDPEVSEQRKIETQRKHEILFMMGIALLVLLLTTSTLGIAMVAFGKDVFVAHMIMAGLSMTLAIVHAVTSTVWFWPY